MKRTYPVVNWEEFDNCPIISGAEKDLLCQEAATAIRTLRKLLKKFSDSDDPVGLFQDTDYRRAVDNTEEKHDMLLDKVSTEPEWATSEIERLEAENKKLQEAYLVRSWTDVVDEYKTTITKQAKVIEVVNDLCCGEDGMFSRRQICQEILSTINAEGK